jgi:hypothetical protein
MMSSRYRGLAFAILAGGAADACSIVSGWSDLQWTRAPDDDAASTDVATPTKDSCGSPCTDDEASTPTDAQADQADVRLTDAQADQAAVDAFTPCQSPGDCSGGVCCVFTGPGGTAGACLDSNSMCSIAGGRPVCTPQSGCAAGKCTRVDGSDLSVCE